MRERKHWENLTSDDWKHMSRAEKQRLFASRQKQDTGRDRYNRDHARQTETILRYAHDGRSDQKLNKAILGMLNFLLKTAMNNTDPDIQHAALYSASAQAQVLSIRPSVDESVRCKLYAVSDKLGRATDSPNTVAESITKEAYTETKSLTL